MRRITYRQLAQIIDEEFTEEQKDYDVTVEDRYEQECYAAELRICDNGSLDDEHPVLWFPTSDTGES